LIEDSVATHNSSIKRNLLFHPNPGVPDANPVGFWTTQVPESVTYPNMNAMYTSGPDPRAPRGIPPPNLPPTRKIDATHSRSSTIRGFHLSPNANLPY
jgi:hypothetical protein